MASTQNVSESDLERGHVDKPTAANPAVTQDIDRVDHGQDAGMPAKPQTTIENTGGIISEASLEKHISRNQNLCRASIDSLDRRVTTPWIPKGMLVEKVSTASLRASGPVRRSVESSSPTKVRLGASDGGVHSLMRIDAIQIRGSGHTIARETGAENTSLSEGADPGVWAIDHHRSNFIQNIKKTTTWNSVLHGLWTREDGPKSGNWESEKWQRSDEANDHRISLAELQRMRLRKLQCQLVKHVAHMKTTGEESENWESDLEAYSKERYVDSYILHSLLGDATKDATEEPIPASAWESTNEPIGGTRSDTTENSESAQFRQRIAIATIAGSFLIGPMWLMVLHNTLYTCLVSTTVFVTVFGIILACSLDSPKEVMSGTAAYAAVLVFSLVWGILDNSAQGLERMCLLVGLQ
ncbi:hypothetical protein F5X98DRAFT_376988 [Xylaria grammica]|nr:hypothetical protein F5X98DRAFT_376988 [Xylaria grammica]